MAYTLSNEKSKFSNIINPKIFHCVCSTFKVAELVLNATSTKNYLQQVKNKIDTR